jgi:hypothetical protein
MTMVTRSEENHGRNCLTDLCTRGFDHSGRCDPSAIAAADERAKGSEERWSEGEAARDGTPLFTVVSSPRPDVKPPVTTYTSDGHGSVCLSEADVRALVADILSHAIGAETPRETVERMGRDLHDTRDDRDEWRKSVAALDTSLRRVTQERDAMRGRITSARELIKDIWPTGDALFSAMLRHRLACIDRDLEPNAWAQSEIDELSKADPTATPPRPMPSEREEGRGGAEPGGTSGEAVRVVSSDAHDAAPSGAASTTTPRAEPGSCEFCSTSSGIVDDYQRAIERLRPGHTPHCNSGFVHGHGECECGTSGDTDALARIAADEYDRVFEAQPVPWRARTEWMRNAWSSIASAVASAVREEMRRDTSMRGPHAIVHKSMLAQLTEARDAWKAKAETWQQEAAKAAIDTLREINAREHAERERDEAVTELRKSDAAFVRVVRALNEADDRTRLAMTEGLAECERLRDEIDAAWRESRAESMRGTWTLATLIRHRSMSVDRYREHAQWALNRVEMRAAEAAAANLALADAAGATPSDLHARIGHQRRELKALNRLLSPEGREQVKRMREALEWIVNAAKVEPGIHPRLVDTARAALTSCADAGKKGAK